MNTGEIVECCPRTMPSLHQRNPPVIQSRSAQGRRSGSSPAPTHEVALARKIGALEVVLGAVSSLTKALQSETGARLSSGSQVCAATLAEPVTDQRSSAAGARHCRPVLDAARFVGAPRAHAPSLTGVERVAFRERRFAVLRAAIDARFFRDACVALGALEDLQLADLEDTAGVAVAAVTAQAPESPVPQPASTGAQRSPVMPSSSMRESQSVHVTGGRETSSDAPASGLPAGIAEHSSGILAQSAGGSAWGSNGPELQTRWVFRLNSNGIAFGHSKPPSSRSAAPANRRTAPCPRPRRTFHRNRMASAPRHIPACQRPTRAQNTGRDLHA